MTMFATKNKDEKHNAINSDNTNRAFNGVE